MSHKINATVRKLFLAYLEDPDAQTRDAELFLALTNHEAVKGPLEVGRKIAQAIAQESGSAP